MYLLDTKVLSELKKVPSQKANVNVAKWALRTSSFASFISAVTVLELTIGLLRIERKVTLQAARIQRWLDDQVLRRFANRILPLDTLIMQRCAKLHVPDKRPERDALIAATALVHGLTLVTRNVADFAPWMFPCSTPGMNLSGSICA